MGVAKPMTIPTYNLPYTPTLSFRAKKSFSAEHVLHDFTDVTLGKVKAAVDHSVSPSRPKDLALM